MGDQRIRLVRISKGFESGPLRKAKEAFRQHQERDEGASFLEVESTELEDHVHTAIRVAASLNGEAPLDARAALIGTLAVARDQGDRASPAFVEIRKLLPLETIPEAKAAEQGLDADVFRFDGAFAALFERSLERARKRRTDARMWGREWIASALLSVEDRSLLRVLREAHVSLADAQDGWHGFVTRTTSPNEPGEWDEVWKQAGVALPAERPVRSGYLPESTAGKDKLGIEGEVRAFARLIADRKTRPPLSIGLLGDWGSGKSFFMELIEREIERAVEGAGAGDFCTNVVQIRFNAWHYSDANLWASMVGHIFEETWKAMAPPTGAEEARREVREQIKEARGAVYEAERQREATLDTLEDAKERHKELSASLAFRDQLDAVRGKQIDKLLAQVGWRKPLQSILDLEKTLDELGESSQRIRLVASTALRGRTLIHAVPWIAASVAAAAGLAWLASFLRTDEAKEVLTFLATVGGSVGSLAAAVGATVARANAVLKDFASELEETIQEYDERAEHDPEIQAKRRELTAVDERLTAARRRLAELEGQLAGLDPSQRLVAFIEERARSEDYRERRGIISLVRQDFEQLSGLMKNWIDDPATRPLKSRDIRPVDRIVLYIDDLDRCSHEVVVQTLEAIHLLLALDLFIVVVGVDSRWLLRSLEKHYETLLSEDGQQRALYRASTPQNYLEKIFQVTYALAPMSARGFEQYVDFLTGTEAVEPSERAAAGKRTSAEARRPNAAAAPPADAGGRDREQRTPGASLAAPAEPPQRERDRADGHEAAPHGSDTSAGAQEPVSDTRALLFREHETAFLKKLHPLVPSPRIAKRVANVYRLIKARVPWAELESMTSAAGRHRPILLLLAILYGRPGVSEELFRRMSEKSMPGTGDGVKLHAAIRDLAAEHASLTSDAATANGRTATLRRLADTVETIAPDLALEACQAEAPELARYSLITGQVWHTWRWPERERAGARSEGPKS